MADFTSDEMRQSIIETFLGLTAQERELLADVFASVNWDAQRSRSLGDTRLNQYPHRVLDGGAAVINQGDGTLAALNTTSLFDTLNFVNGTVSVNEDNRRQADILTTGGADCMFDYLVSSCWAAEVTAGRGTEGQVFTSLTGCTFRIYSTVQGVIDHIAANGASGSEFSVWLCGMTTEDVSVPAMVGGCDNIQFFGAGHGDVDGISGIQGTTTNAVPVLTIATNAPTIHMERVTIRGQGINTFLVDVTGSARLSRWTNCHFTNSSGTGTVGFRFGGGADPTQFVNCKFTRANLITSAVGVDGLLVSGCYFTLSNINLALGQSQDVTIVGNHFDGDDQTITIGEFRGGAITGNVFQSNTTTTTITLGGGGNSQDFTISGNWFGTGSTTLPYIKFAATSQCRDVVITGNTFLHAAASNPFIVSDNADCQFVAVVGNVFGRTGAAFTIIGVSGTFANSTFGPNAPGMRTRYAITGIENQFDCVVVDAGAPSGTAHEGTLYFDSTANTLYINTDGATTWAVVGVSGGGAAAPSPHNLVSVHHDGEQDYTNTLGLLGLGVSTGDLTMYSDAGITVVGTWDGALGHAVFGGVGAPGATTIINATKNFTDPAASVLAFNTTLGMVMTAGNANAMNASQGNLSYSGGFTASGIGTSFRSSISMSGALTVVSDARGFSSLAGGASGTITDRYGFYVANGTGGGSITNQYGLYIENMAKGGTLNRAIYSAGGASVHAGSFRIGDTTAPITTLDVRGAVTLDGVAAPSTPASDDMAVFNATGTDLLKAIDDNGAVYALTHKHVVQAVIDGATGSTTTPYIVAGPMPHAGTIVGAYAKTCENITIGATAWVGDVHKILAANANTDGQGTTIFTVKPTITNGNMYQSYGAPDSVTTFAAGDYMAFFTDVAGTNATFITMSLDVRYT